MVEAGCTASRQPPNIIIILADDLGYGDLGCYGNPTVNTPHIDRLAAEGMLFTDFHSSGAVCSPTRASLITGRYPQRAGIPSVIVANPKRATHRHGLHAHELSFAKLLRDAGYSTGIFGKWHLGYYRHYNPIHHGFTRFRGYVSGNIDYFSHVNQAGTYDWWDGDNLVEEKGYTTHLITKHAVEFIEENQDRPFCLYIAHEAVHYPYQGPNDRPERTRDGHTLPGRTDRCQAYREMTEEMDKGVGEVMATLKRLGLEQQTLVFFFSDNGATTAVGSNAPLRGGKSTVWEGGHRIPAIAWWPGRIAQGVRCDDLAFCCDLLPTMVALAGLSLPVGEKIDGVDLSSLLLEGAALPERSLFWEHGAAKAMRQGVWKLVVHENHAYLYNVAKDLGEQCDLATDHPKRVQAMLDAIAAWKQDVTTGATIQPDHP